MHCQWIFLDGEKAGSLLYMSNDTVIIVVMTLTIHCLTILQLDPDAHFWA